MTKLKEKLNMPGYDEKKVNRYNAYVQALCTHYTYQLNLPAEQIDAYAQNIKPLVDELVGCLYTLAKYLSFSEIMNLYQNLELMNEKDFCLSVYSKYQKHEEHRFIGSLTTLFYTFLLRDFYIGDFEKISKGGNFGPRLLELIQLCNEHKPYEELRRAIYFPEEEVPYLDSAGLKLLISRSKDAIVPPGFDKEKFKAIMVHENLTEVASTMNNIVIASKEKEVFDYGSQALQDKAPLSWIQTHMTPKGTQEAQTRKKVTFDESLPTLGSPKKIEPKKTK